MRKRAQKRKNKRKHGNSTWKLRVHDKVLVRIQPSSDAIAGVTGTFIRPFEGPYMIDTVIPLSTIEGCVSNVKIKSKIKRSI
jgi:hypothetical protein